jgi:hypothetical protein
MTKTDTSKNHALEVRASDTRETAMTSLHSFGVLRLAVFVIVVPADFIYAVAFFYHL